MTAIDLCDDEVAAKITFFVCFTFTKSGKRVDKTESCVVAALYETIAILDAGGAGNHGAWTAESVDASGNVGRSEFEVEVVRPEPMGSG